MKFFIVLILVSVFGAFEALRCELHKTNGEKIKNALSQCMKDKNNETFWEMSSEDEENSSEGTQNNTESSVNNSKSATFRAKRASDDASKNKTMQENSSDKDNSTSKDFNPELNENCIIQCVLSSMELVDSNGMPDHEKLLKEIVNATTTRELHNFLQDSIDQCYQELNKGDNLDNCSYSTKLIKCLADKGRENCADWPAGGLPF